MTAMDDAARQKTILVRLNRAEGQLGGVRRMMESGRPCLELMQQISALRAALAGVGVLVLQQYVQAELIAPGADPTDLAKTARQLAEVVTQFIA
jgi:DNA-binding FrmR family transcriptional regulator